MGREAWWATVHGVAKELHTTYDEGIFKLFVELLNMSCTHSDTSSLNIQPSTPRCCRTFSPLTTISVSHLA